MEETGVSVLKGLTSYSEVNHIIAVGWAVVRKFLCAGRAYNLDVYIYSKENRCLR